MNRRQHRLKKKKRVAGRNRDKRWKERQLEETSRPIGDFLDDETTYYGPQDSDSELEVPDIDLPELLNVKGDVRGTRDVMQSKMETLAKSCDITGGQASFMAHRPPQQLWREDPDLVMDEYEYQKTNRAGESFVNTPKSNTKLTLYGKPGSQQPLISDSDYSSSDDSAFEGYEEKSMWPFDWKTRIGGSMFQDLDAEVLRTLLHLRSVRIFCFQWMPFSYICNDHYIYRSLFEWKVMIMNSCGYIVDEFFNEHTRKYTIEVSFREFEEGEIQELLSSREESGDTVIRREDFMGYASDFLRAHIICHVHQDSYDACLASELTRRTNRAKSSTTPEEKLKPESVQPQNRTVRHETIIERRLDDMEIMQRHEEAVVARLARRNVNDTYRNFDAMRVVGKKIKMRITKVYCYWL